MVPARRAHQTIIALAVFLAVHLFGQLALASGVSVAPHRIVLEGRTFAATVYLSNRGNQPATYRIGLARLHMTESGEVVRSGDEDVPGVLFADDLIRYSPRRCVVPARGSQTVRLLVRRPRGDMAQVAEYRTHLAIRTIPDVPNLEDVEETVAAADSANADASTFSISTVATLETLVPIIIRFGRLEATPSINSVRIEEPPDTGGRPKIHVSLAREGNRSLYGTMNFTYVGRSGTETELGTIRGLALYTPLTSRTVQYPFDLPPNVNLDEGTLRVDFVESEDGGGDGEASLAVSLESDQGN